MNAKSGTAALLLSCACVLQAGLPSPAQTSVLTGSVAKQGRIRPQEVAGRAEYYTNVRPAPARAPAYRRVYIRDNRTFWQRHPKVKSAAIGAGVGAGAGAVVGLVSHRGVVRGAAIGAGTGAGVGLVRSSRTMRRHPILRDVATGSLVGLGIGGAASRRGGTAVKGAGVGAAVGLGVGLLKNGLR